VKHRKPLVSNNMEEDRGESEIRAAWNQEWKCLRGPTLPTSQISSPQAQAESSIVTTESQAVSSLSDDSFVPDRKSAATHIPAAFIRLLHSSDRVFHPRSIVTTEFFPTEFT